MTQLIIVGGFLGAGKTTLLWHTAQQLIQQGKKVALITNDQGPELVDSTLLEHQGLQVAEVNGSCFVAISTVLWMPSISSCVT